MNTAARALASAFLAGEWEPGAMAARGRSCLGDRRVWVRRLAEVVWHAYPEPPRDRPRELAEVIAACEPFQGAELRAIRAGTQLQVRRWFTAETAMGRAALDPAWPVLALPTVGDVARWLELSPGELAWLADLRSLERTAEPEALRNYRYRWATKPRGGGRLLEIPKPRLRDRQRRLLRDVLGAIPAHEAAHGFRPGRSPLSYARPHTGQQAVLHVDLEGFFASVPAGRVYAIFRTAGYPEPVAHVLTGLCTNAVPRPVWRAAPRTEAAAASGAHHRLGRHLATPHLPQGAPTSPALANLAASGLDRRLAGLARRFGLVYTRYADDLAFSGDDGLVRTGWRVAQLVEGIVADEGFRVNRDKTRMATAAGRQRLAGVVVNRHPNVPRDDYDVLKAVLHNCLRTGPAAQNRTGHPDFRSHLAGRVAWVASVNPERGRRLQRDLARIRW